MEIRHVVIFHSRVYLRLSVLIGFVCLIASMPTLNIVDNAQAEKKQTVRFYKVNRQLQADRLRFTNRAAKKAGCHNFIKKTRVHRIVQLGYERCSLYAKKSCLAESVLSAVTEKDKTPVTNLSQGVSWFFDIEHKRGERAKSWYCE